METTTGRGLEPTVTINVFGISRCLAFTIPIQAGPKASTPAPRQNYKAESRNTFPACARLRPEWRLGICIRQRHTAPAPHCNPLQPRCRFRPPIVRGARRCPRTGSNRSNQILGLNPTDTPPCAARMAQVADPLSLSSPQNPVVIFNFTINSPQRLHAKRFNPLKIGSSVLTRWAWRHWRSQPVWSHSLSIFNEPCGVESSVSIPSNRVVGFNRRTSAWRTWPTGGFNPLKSGRRF